MARFTYSALSSTGELLNGELDGLDAAAVIERLHEQNLLPIEAAEKEVGVAGGLSFRFRRRPRFAGDELALFSRQLANLLKAGLPLDRALDMLVSLPSAKRRSATVVQGVLERLRDGASLAEAMDRQFVFPKAYISMVRAGEAGGGLQDVLGRVANLLVRTNAMRQRVSAAMVYPALLTTAALISIGCILTVVLPQFEPVFHEAGNRLPSGMRTLMALSDMLRDFWWTIPVGLLIFGLTAKLVFRNGQMALRRDRAILGMPFVGDLVMLYEVGRFSHTLGTLLANGVPAPSALPLCGNVINNRALAAAVGDVARELKEGGGLSQPLAGTGRFPALLVQFVRIGEETGRLDEMLQQVGEIYDAEMQRKLDSLIALLVPVITVVMGIVVALLVAAVMSALVSINDLAV